MARPKSTTLTEGERRIMEVLWKLGDASVQDVTDELARGEGIAYTTTLTMLRILTEKGYTDYRQDGKAYIFQPLITRQEAQSRALKDLIKRFFDDAPEALAQRLIQDTNVDLSEVDRLEKRINQAKQKKER
jgi:predicted transcriptional regulator